MIYPTVCIYHGNCPDGFASAWIIHEAGKDHEEPEPAFIPAQYGQPPPDGLDDEDVYIVDFSYKREVMEEIAARANSVTVLDHHKTAEGELNPLLQSGVIDGEFDMAWSGAALTWRWFHPDCTLPILVHYVHDRDLWLFKAPDSREINAWIWAHPMDFDVWTDLYRTLENNPGLPVAAGKALLMAEDKRVDTAVERAFPMRIEGHDVFVAHSTTDFSQIANLLARGRPFGACFFLADAGTRVVFSLRSEETGVDVSEIAKRFGGGGHEHAAGFSVPLNGFDPVELSSSL